MQLAPGGRGGQNRECSVPLITEGHLDRVIRSLMSGVMTDVTGQLSRPRWWCGRTEQGRDGKDGHGESDLEPN